LTVSRVTTSSSAMRRLGARCQQREHLQLTGGQLPGRARHRLGGASPLALYGVGHLQHPARQPSSTPRAEGPCRGGVAGESPRRPESARPSAPALAAHRRCPQRKSTFCRSFRVALRGPFGPGRVSASKLSFPVSSSVAIWCTHRGRHPGTPARPDPVPAAGPRRHCRARAGPMGLSCPLAGCGRFHRHGHLRVTLTADAGSYRLMQDQPQDDRGPQDQVHPQPRPEVRNVSTPAPVPAG
jgi:hypothetical protein